jgi:hypothetical protein
MLKSAVKAVAKAEARLWALSIPVSIVSKVSSSAVLKGMNAEGTVKAVVRAEAR